VTKTVQKTGFRSGIAARLAGIPVETLRVWERRYGLTGASSKEGGHRLYDQGDIDRLALLKRLVDFGQPVGTIAHLDSAALLKMQQDLISLAQQANQKPVNEPTQIALVGPVMGSGVLKGALQSENLVVAAQAMSLSQLQSERPGETQIDALFVEIPNLLDTAASEVREVSESLRIERVVIFYRFAPDILIRRLRTIGYSVVRMPFDVQELVLLCGALMKREPSVVVRDPPAAADETDCDPKFSTESLVRLSHMKSSVYCECPSQLAELLMSITAFERYSAQCASQTPADANLHKQLELDAIKIRKILEASITNVIQHENIPI